MYILISCAFGHDAETESLLVCDPFNKKSGITAGESLHYIDISMIVYQVLIKIGKRSSLGNGPPIPPVLI